MTTHIADKSLVDELIRLTRKYWRTSDTDILDAKLNAARKVSTSVFGKDDNWIDFSDMTSAAFRLSKNTSNQQIYDIFKAYGIEVRGEAKGNTSPIPGDFSEEQ